jgi:hypothetical protein
MPFSRADRLAWALLSYRHGMWSTRNSISLAGFTSSAPHRRASKILPGRTDGSSVMGLHMELYICLYKSLRVGFPFVCPIWRIIPDSISQEEIEYRKTPDFYPYDPYKSNWKQNMSQALGEAFWVLPRNPRYSNQKKGLVVPQLSFAPRRHRMDHRDLVRQIDKLIQSYVQESNSLIIGFFKLAISSCFVGGGMQYCLCYFQSFEGNQNMSNKLPMPNSWKVDFLESVVTFRVRNDCAQKLLISSS